MCECEAHNGTPAFEERACVVSNESLGPRLYKITLAAPKTAAAIRPGQFVHMLLPGFGAHILRRPFSVYAAKGDNVEIIYQTVGEGTADPTEVETGAWMLGLSRLWAMVGSRARAKASSWAVAWVPRLCSCSPSSSCAKAVRSKLCLVPKLPA